MDYKKIVRAILSRKNLTVDEQINALKINVNAGEYRDALKLNPAFSKVINRTPFFKSTNEIYLKDPYTFTRNFKKEYRWITNIIENHFTEINSFLEFKNSFEKHIILEEYELAKSVLIRVENEFGISLWSIEANLILEENINGSEANWNRLSEYLGEIANSIYEFVINFSSKRIESKLSYESYLNQFQNEIDIINADGLLEDFFVFKNFNIANYVYRYTNLESVLYVTNIFSIIDQYLILIDVILYNLSESNENDKIFLPFINKARTIINQDCRIQNIYNIINDKKEIILFEENQTILPCLNLYYSGDFENAFENSQQAIILYPLEFEYYEIYCKSLINLQKEFIPTGLSKTIDFILQQTFDLLSFKNDKEDSWKKLLKVSLFMMNTNFGKRIFGLLSEIEDKNEQKQIVGFLSSNFNSHKNLMLENRKSIIEANFNQLLGNHVYKVQRYKQGGDNSFSNEISSSDYQETVIKAIRSFTQQNYLDVVEILQSREDIDAISYYSERKMSLLYYSYLNLGLLKEALILFGKIFFDDLTVTRKLNYNELYGSIKKMHYKEQVLNLIEYPILFSLIVKEYDLYEAYDDFMGSVEMFEVEEINIDFLIREFTLNKVVYFLQNVATIDTLKYSTEYKSISDVEDDRIKILKILLSIDVSNKLVYEKEIIEIYRINSVRKVLKEVDEGRLYIDVTSLKGMQTKKFRDDFKRFKEIETSSTMQTLIGFNTSNTKNWERALTEKNSGVEKYNSADYLAFKSIYLESRENFLFSKEYGLDSCLSTRIRHGALKNHIRSVFEKLNLVTSKSNEKYKDNDFWANQLVAFPEINIEVQTKLKEFSKEIDEYRNFIVENLIQIQTEKNSENSEGLFQYFTNDELLHSFYVEHKNLFDSVESTIEIILNTLVNYTIFDIQGKIIEAFTSVISNKFQELIDHLVSQLKDLNLPNECELIPNLKKSSTEIHKELEYLSEWFSLNTTSSSSLLDLETIINASLNLTNRINPLFNLSPEIKLDKIFAGYSNLIFVFNIMFNNVIAHSQLDTDKIKLKIESAVDESQKYVLIKFTNNLNPNHDYASNKMRLEAVKANWNNHENIERSNKEGESGYDKIKRILLYEALAKTDRFDFTISKSSITITLYFPYKTLQNE